MFTEEYEDIDGRFIPGDPSKQAKAIFRHNGIIAVPCQNDNCTICGCNFAEIVEFDFPYRLRMVKIDVPVGDGQPLRSCYIAHRITEKPPSPYEDMFLDGISSALIKPKLGVKIKFLGGLGRAGTNTCVMVQSGMQAILVDCGTNVAKLETEEAGETDEEATTDEADETSEFADNPNFQPLIDFCANGGKVLGIILTHGHFDHIGGLPALSKAMSGFDLPPVFGQRFTTSVAYHLMNTRIEEDPTLRMFEFQNIFNAPIQLGCFHIEPIQMIHSIPGASGYVVNIVDKKDQGGIFFTGDFKARWSKPEDYSDEERPEYLFDFEERLATLGPIRAVFCDCTYANRPGWTSLEQDVKQGLLDAILSAEGRVLITLFASHMERIEAIVRLCSQMGKTVSWLGTSVKSYLDAYDTVGRTLTMSLDPQKADVIIVAGCQGNEFSASRRLSEGKWVDDIRIQPGDTVVISANPIPGRVKNVTAMAYAYQTLGAKVIINNSFPGRMVGFERGLFHVSGHGSSNDISFLIKTLFGKNPDMVFAPYHCDHDQAIAGAKLADEAGLNALQILLYEQNGSEILL